MKKLILFLMATIFFTGIALAGNVKLGKPLPQVTIEKKGHMVPEYTIQGGKMVFKEGSEIKYRPFNSSELTGKVRCIYHLAARAGTDEINKAFIDALIAAKLPEVLPDSPFKTTTILNTDDAFFGTAGIGSRKLESSQKDVAYALYVNDAEGKALKAWGLKPKGSAVMILNKSGNVMYFKDGKMSSVEISSVVNMIKKELGM